jgi:hypothetical protein
MQAAGRQWLMPIILATWEAEIRRTTVQACQGKKFARPPSQSIAGCVCVITRYGVEKNVEIQRIMLQGQPWQKIL